MSDYITKARDWEMVWSCVQRHSLARVSWYCPLVRADSWLLVATRIEQWILERLSFHRLGYDGTGICGPSMCMGRSVAGRVMAGMCQPGKRQGWQSQMQLTWL